MSHQAALATGDALALFAIGLPGFSLYLLLIASFQAMQDTRTMFYLYLLENGINVVVALVLFPFMQVQGLALAYSIAYALAAAVSLVTLARRLDGGTRDHWMVRTTGDRWIVRTTVRVTLASVVMGVVVFVLSRAIGTASRPRLLLDVGVSVVVGATVYLFSARRLGVAEVTTLAGRVHKPRR